MDRHNVIYLDGLERSGNVYLSYVLNESMDIELRTLRNHKIEVLKEYNRTNAFIVPVRDAFESIASAKVYRDYV
jgi:hypothetical protein